jgi:ethanolamine utilization protein EutA (predicted chaperonin)
MVFITVLAIVDRVLLSCVNFCAPLFVPQLKISKRDVAYQDQLLMGETDAYNYF